MIEAALTAEEWAAHPNTHHVRFASMEPGAPGGEVKWTADRPLSDPPLYFPTRHGIAAVNLHGQPFGFTWEDVDMIRRYADNASQHWAFGDEAGLGALADRIEALLSPR